MSGPDRTAPVWTMARGHRLGPLLLEALRQTIHKLPVKTVGKPMQPTIHLNRIFRRIIYPLQWVPFLLLSIALAGDVSLATARGSATIDGSTPSAIPWSELGARADKDTPSPVPELHEGQGHLVAPLQAMKGKISPEGLSVESTSATEGQGHFQLYPFGLGRAGVAAPIGPGSVTVSGSTVQLDRGLLREVFSASTDGLRQDFVIDQKPGGPGPLQLDLRVEGARVSADASGVALTLPAGRKLVYHRLHITDAAGQLVQGTLQPTDDQSLRITVLDHKAQYPLTIDPTITDADWQAWNSGIPGTNGLIKST